MWAKDHKSGHSVLAKFSKMSTYGYYLVHCAGVLDIEDTYIKQYKYCEPFIGKLPSNLKDK